jgi:hypothetical protein
MMRRIAYLALLTGLVLRLWIVLTKPEMLWIDDSFYSLGIARNIALGHGWIHDGLHVTNGFQPLYVFLMIPFYWFLPPNGTLIPTLALLGQAFINTATGWLLYRLIAKQIGLRSGLLVAVIWSFSPYVINGINALETPLSTFVMLIIVHLYLTRWRARLVGSTPWRSAIELGSALGVLLLVRIDNIVFVGLLLLELSYRLLKARPQRGLAVLAAVGLLAGIFVGGWFALSYLNTGRLNFDSGTATRLHSIASYDGSDIVYTHFAQVRTTFTSYVMSPFLPWLQQNEIYLALSLLALLGLIGLAWRHTPMALRPRHQLVKELTFFWLLIVLLPAAYVTYQFTVWMWDRYFYPSLCPY